MAVCGWFDTILDNVKARARAQRLSATERRKYYLTAAVLYLFTIAAFAIPVIWATLWTHSTIANWIVWIFIAIICFWFYFGTIVGMIYLRHLGYGDEYTYIEEAEMWILTNRVREFYNNEYADICETIKHYKAHLDGLQSEKEAVQRKLNNLPARAPTWMQEVVIDSD